MSHFKFTFFHSWHTAIQTKARSHVIDRRIREDSKKLRNEYKVVVLGSSESGKSTIIKQMKIIHQNGFNTEELMTFRPIIYRNTLDSAQALILIMRKLNLDCVDPMNRVNASQILDYHVESAPSFVFSPEIARAIHKLYQDEAIPQVMDLSSEFYLMDSAAYFFENVERIGTPDYCPTTSDMLRARAMTTGITEMRFTRGESQICIFDLGYQRSEQRKWIHCFESVTSIIFCTALSEYDQVLPGGSRNRMVESLFLFDSIVNSCWFSRTSIILFLNKVDVFKIKLPKVPLERYFPDYTGGADFRDATDYITRRFMQKNRARLEVYVHKTQATDTANARIVFAAVEDTILRNVLNGFRIL